MLSFIYHPHHKAHLKNWRMRNKAVDFLWSSTKFLNKRKCLGFSTPRPVIGCEEEEKEEEEEEEEEKTVDELSATCYNRR